MSTFALDVAELRALNMRATPALLALLSATRRHGCPVYASQVAALMPDGTTALQAGQALHDASKWGLCLRQPGGTWLVSAKARRMDGRLV